MKKQITALSGLYTCTYLIALKCFIVNVIFTEPRIRKGNGDNLRIIFLIVLFSFSPLKIRCDNSLEASRQEGTKAFTEKILLQLCTTRTV